MSNKKRPYLVINQTTGSEELVIAISQAQAISHMARTMLSAYPAAPLDVVKHMANGGKVTDATAEPQPKEAPPGGDAGTGAGPGAGTTEGREGGDGGETFDDADIGDDGAAPGVGGGDPDDWQAHLKGGIAGTQ